MTTGGGEGVLLAKGYIALSVKYAGAMSQVSKDFDTIEAKAKETGQSSGAVMGKEMTAGVTTATKEMPTALKPVEKHAEETGKAAGKAMGKEVTTGVEAAAKDAGKAFKPIEIHAEKSGANAGEALIGGLAKSVKKGDAVVYSSFALTLKKAKEGAALSGKEAGTLLMGALGSGITEAAGSLTRKVKAVGNVGHSMGRELSNGILWSMGRDLPERVDGVLTRAIGNAQAGMKLRFSEMATIASGAAANVLGRGAGIGLEASLNAMGSETPLRAGRAADTAESHHRRMQALTQAAKAEEALALHSGDSSRLRVAEEQSKKARKAEDDALEAALKARKHHHDVLQNFDMSHELRTGIGRLASGATHKIGAGFQGMATSAKGAIASIAGPLMGLVSGPMAALIAGLGTAAGIGMTLKAGFDKATEIEKFRVKLETLGHSAGQVQGAISAAGVAVKDTTFDIGDMLDTAVSAIESGGSTGLVPYLRTVAETATVTGQSIADTDKMLSEFRRDGMVTVDALKAVKGSGLPISKWLSQDLHVAETEMDDFVAHQGLSHRQLMDTIERHSHEGAQRINRTFDAQIKILGKNLTNIGQAIMAPFIGVGAGPFEGLNHSLEKFADWLTKHQPEIIGFFGEIATGIEHMAATGLSWLSKIQIGVANTLKGLSYIPGLGGLEQVADALAEGAKGMQSWADSINNHAIPATQALVDKQKLLVGFNQALKDKFDETKIAITELNSSGGLEIKDATPNIIQNLEALKIHLRQIGNDPTHLEIIPDTANAITLINDMRRDEGLKPIPIPVELKLGAAEQTLGHWAAQQRLQIPVDILTPPGIQLPGEYHPAPGQPNRPTTPGIPGLPGEYRPSPPAHRAEGGFTSLPSSAIVQSAVHPKGLVQWAEPSTGGEAYIPLATSKRERSVSIWRQTGNLLGIKSFSGGGLNGQPGIDDQGFDTSQLPPWLRQQWDDMSDKERAVFKWQLGLMGQRRLDAPFAGMQQQTGQFRPGITLDTSMVMNERSLAEAERARLFAGVWGRSYNDGGIDGGGLFGGLGGGVRPGVASWQGSGLDAAHAFLSTVTGGAPGTQRSAYHLGGFSPSSVDCSGLVSAVVNAYLGLSPFSSRMSTSSEESWLKAKGFKMGVGPPGSLQVGWYDHGGGAFGHTALTLPDGTNAESTTSHGISGARVGALAAGAGSSQFSQHAYLMPAGPEWMSQFPVGGGGGHGRGPGGGGFSRGFGAGGGGGARVSPAGFGSGGAGGGGGARVSPAGWGGGDGPGAAGSGGSGAPGGSYGGVGPGGVDRGLRSADSYVGSQANTSDQARIDQLQRDLDAARKALDEIKHGKPGDLPAAESRVKSLTDELQSATGGSGGGNNGNDPFNLGGLADIGVSGLTESLLPPGFSNPMNSPLMKMGAGLLKFLGGLMPGLIPGEGGQMAGQGLALGGALMSGSGSGVVSALQGFQQKPYGNMQVGSPGSAPAAGQLGGSPVKTAGDPLGGGGIDNSVNYFGSVNGDMSKFTDMHSNMVTSRDRASTTDIHRIGMLPS